MTDMKWTSSDTFFASIILAQLAVIATLVVLVQ
jgi:hypothetical protein